MRYIRQSVTIATIFLNEMAIVSESLICNDKNDV